MKHNAFRITALLVTFLLSTTIMYSTGQQENTGIVGVDSNGKYLEPVTVTTIFNSDPSVTNALQKMGPDESIEKNRLIDLYAEKLNINIEYQYVVDSSQSENRINLMIASGDLPDFFEVNSYQAKSLNEADLIRPVDSIFDNNASDSIKSYFADAPSAWDALTFNGVRMGIPRPAEPISGAGMVWLRRDWLENLNLPEPKTNQELIDVITAFALNDPDQNGKNDTYGMGMGQAWINGNLMGVNAFLHSFSAYMGSDNWLMKDGKAVPGVIQPEVKDTLSILSQMYKAKLLDPEFAIKGDQQLREDVANGKFGLFFGEHFLGTRLDANKANDPGADWITIPIPEGRPLVSGRAARGTVLTKEFKYPEAFVKMVNLHGDIYTSEDLGTYEYYHSKGDIQPWRVAPIQTKYYLPIEKNLYTQTAIAEALKTGDPDAAYDKVKNRVTKGEFFLTYQKCFDYEAGKNDKLYGVYTIFGPEGSERILVDYKKEDRPLPNAFDGPATETSGEKQNILDSLRDELFVNIIMGQESIDAFDQFVVDYMRLGGTKITEEVNEWLSNNK